MSPHRCLGGALLARLRAGCSLALAARCCRCGLGSLRPRWFRAELRGPGRLPSVRYSACAEWSAAHGHLRLRAAFRTLARNANRIHFPVQEAAAASRSSWPPCAFRRRACAATRCFLPTSATNVRSMYPRSVRFPSVELSPPPTDPARGDPAFRRVTLTHGRRRSRPRASRPAPLRSRCCWRAYRNGPRSMRV